MNNMRNKILSLLVLLLTAATGAWAQDVDGTIAWSVGNEASATVSASIKDAISSTGVTTGSGLTVANATFLGTSMVKYQPATANAGNVSGVMIEYTIEAVDGYKFKPTGVDYAAVKQGTDNASYSWSYTIDGVESAITDVSKDDVLRDNGNNSATAQLMHSESITADGCSVFTLRFYISMCANTKNIGIGNITISGSVSAAPEPGVEVTTNAASEGATFTEATFQMPAFDATADYELVRDMSVEMTAQVGDGTQEQPRYRVKKDGNKFIPAEMEMAAVPALFTVNDAIEQKALTQKDYIVEIYAVDAEGNPTGQPMTFATFTFEPGIYAVKAVAAQGSDYDGETALSNTFKLFQGYEVEVAAKEFITYYKDEPLYADTETSADAQLYTIQSVSGDQAQLSAAIETAPSYTPLLIFNNSDQDKTFLLIPAEAEPNLTLDVYAGFQGTLTGTTIAASNEGTTNYALNGKAFVFVKNAIEVGPNKAWLSINTGEPSARITLVFDDETTKITTTNLTNLTNGDWYDLNGRKLDKMPTKKGVYILNGKKVVVR